MPALPHPPSRQTPTYWMLVTSLPPLPSWDHICQLNGQSNGQSNGQPSPATGAIPLPIGAERLQTRLAMLHPDDAQALADTRAYLAWRHTPPLSDKALAPSSPGLAPGTDTQPLQQAAQLVQRHPQAAVAPLVQEALGQRLWLAVLRQRLRRPADSPKALQTLLQHASPQAPTGLTGHRAWGVARRWTEPDFGLAHSEPWLPLARQLLHSGDALGLERLLDARLWARCDALRCTDRFGFAAVLAYGVQWDLARRWLQHSAPDAREQLRQWLAARSLRATQPPAALAIGQTLHPARHPAPG